MQRLDATLSAQLSLALSSSQLTLRDKLSSLGFGDREKLNLTKHIDDHARCKTIYGLLSTLWFSRVADISSSSIQVEVSSHLFIDHRSYGNEKSK